MTYAIVADITQSASLRQRITAAAAEQKKPKPYPNWVNDNIWDIASTEGWAEKWGECDSGDPGAQEECITDEMIRTAILAIATPTPTGQ